MSERLKALIDQLPAGLRSDWDGTNHYEMTTPGPEGYWWLNLRGMFDPAIVGECDISATTPGKRLGLLLDIAEELVKIRDGGADLLRDDGP